MTASEKTARKKLNLDPVYREVSQILLHKNPEQVSFSLVAKKTKVPRTTLYYYFNSDVKSLIVDSIRFTMKEFMQLWETEAKQSVTSFENWGQLQKYKFQRAIRLVESHPALLQLYFRYCSHPSFVGDEIRYIEKLYLQNTEKDWHQFHSTKLDHRLQHLLAQMKIGILWGLTGEVKSWQGQEEKLAAICAQIFSLFETLNSTASAS